MLHRALTLGLLVALVAPARALTLEDVRVQATLVDGSAKDPFRIRGRLAGADLRAVVDGFALIRVGDLVGNAPAGGFRRRGRTYTWRSYLYGVKRVTINVKKGTVDIVGGGVELGDFAGPVRLAIGTSKGVVCGTFDWAAAQVTHALPSGRRGVRKTATGPLEPCFPPPDGLDHQAPSVFITSPTPLPGVASTSASVDLGGDAVDDIGVTGLTWSNDQGGGGSIASASSWSVAGIPLVPGDNRITVTASDAAGNVGSDVVTVTHNTNGIEFEGMPVSTPEAILMKDPASLTLRQKILSNPNLDPASVEVLHLTAGGTTAVGVLQDTGNRQTGDDLPGDDVYSGVMGVVGGTNATEPEYFRVAARTTTQPDVVALSPVVMVSRIEPVPHDAVAAAITLADNARDLFTSLVGDGVDLDAALDEVVLLAKASGARAAGPAPGRLAAWWMTEDGLLGGMLGYDQGTRRGGAGPVPPRPSATSARPHPVANATPSRISTWNEVGSRRTIVLAPYFQDAEPLAVDGMLRAMQCPQYEVDTFVGSAADAERFKNLEEYGLVVVASHGDTLFDALGDAYPPEWDWKSTGGQAVLLTGTSLSSVNLRKWQTDLRMGRMAIFPGGVIGVLPSYFTQYSVRLPQSIVYMGACGSTATPSLSSALLERGAGAVLGFDAYVESSFAHQAGLDLFTKLLEGKSLAQAFTPGQQDGGTPPSTFMLDGSSALGLATGPIVNRSFEVQSGFLASVAGFTVSGDGRIIGNLGMTLPTDGARMALVSTGLGLTTQSGAFAQSVCLPPLPPGATQMRLEYDWNFFSEEFLEYCGSQYQDFFQVTFGSNVLHLTKVDDLCNDPGTVLVPADVSFDQGNVYMTGWRTQAVDVTPFAGTTDTLRFAAGDVGDSIYDTVILVDNVRLVVQ
jgi:hypothetical protein